MKSYFIILIILITSACQRYDNRIQNIKSYSVEVYPEGITDVPMTILSIKILPTQNAKDNRNTAFIQTNAETLKYLVNFVTKNNSYTYTPNEKFIEFGCSRIRVYKNNKIITSYFLNNSDSRKYITSLIKSLTDANLDTNLTNHLKDKLAEISY